MLTRLIYENLNHVTTVSAQSGDIVFQSGGTSGEYALTVKKENRPALMKLLGEMQCVRDGTRRHLKQVIEKPLKFVIDEETLRQPSDYAILTACCELFGRRPQDPFDDIERVLVQLKLAEPSSYWR